MKNLREHHTVDGNGLDDKGQGEVWTDFTASGYTDCCNFVVDFGRPKDGGCSETVTKNYDDYVSPSLFVDGGYMRLVRFSKLYHPDLLGFTEPARTFGGGYIAVREGLKGADFVEVAYHEIMHNRHPDASEMDIRRKVQQDIPSARYQL